MKQVLPLASLEGNNIHVKAFGRLWTLERKANLEQLWDEMGSEDFGDERIPYWIELWPASLVLAQWLHNEQEQIRGKLCLDLGCGLGFTALVGSWLGARMLACDYELDSLVQASANAALNGVPEPAWLCMDWRRPALFSRSLDAVWAGDIFYEKRAVRPVFEALDQILGSEGKFWIADPGRGIFSHFIELASTSGWSLKQVFRGKTMSPYPQDIGITATIWEGNRL